MSIRINGDNTAANPGITGADTDTGLSFGTNEVSINTDGTERFRVGSSGELGIGGATYGTSGQVLTSQGSGSAPQWSTIASDSITEGNTSVEVVDTGSDGHITFDTEGSPRARIDSSGRLLVGLTSNTANTTLALQGSSGGSAGEANLRLLRGAANPTAATKLGNIIFSDGQNQEGVVLEGSCDDNWSSGSSFPSRLIVKVTPSGGTAPVEHTRFRADGAVIVGENTDAAILSGSPEYLLAIGQASGSANAASGCVQVRSVGNSGKYSFLSNVVYNGHFSFYWRSNVAGSITSPNSNSVSYNTSSDYRLKENVVPLTGAIDRVNQLQVHRFNFIASPDSTVDGFMAHEAQTVVPECATGFKDEVEVWQEGEELPDGVSVGDNKLDEDGNTIPVYQGIDQSKLVPLLTAALQEALAKIETLETRLTALEGGTN